MSEFGDDEEELYNGGSFLRVSPVRDPPDPWKTSSNLPAGVNSSRREAVFSPHPSASPLLNNSPTPDDELTEGHTLSQPSSPCTCDQKSECQCGSVIIIRPSDYADNLPLGSSAKSSLDIITCNSGDSKGDTCSGGDSRGGSAAVHTSPSTADETAKAKKSLIESGVGLPANSPGTSGGAGDGNSGLGDDEMPPDLLELSPLQTKRNDKPGFLTEEFVEGGSGSKDRKYRQSHIIMLRLLAHCMRECARSDEISTCGNM